MAKRKVTGQTKTYLDTHEEAKSTQGTDENAANKLALHNQARSLYAAQEQVMLDVEQVYRADWDPPQDEVEQDIERIGMSKAQTIVNKFKRALGVRSVKTYRVAPQANTAQESARCDLLQRVLFSYYGQHEEETMSDVYSLAAHMLILRGRCGVHTVYLPGEEEFPKVRQLALDPLTYFPVKGTGGAMRLFTKETWSSTFMLKDYAESLQLPWQDPKEGDQGFDPLTNSLRMVEVWEKDYFCQVVGPYTLRDVPLDYGALTLREARLNETAMQQEEWKCRPLLASIIPELAGYAAAMSKMATGVEDFLWPILAVVDADGSLRPIQFRPGGPLDPVPLGENQNIVVINPQPNEHLLQNMMQAMDADISKATMSNVAFSQDIPNASGNLYDTVLGQIQDDLADVRDALQRCFSKASGDVLRLLEKYAADEPDGAWEFPVDARPNQRQTIVKLTADDIAGHWRVKVNIKPDLPESMIQKATIYNQMRQPNPTTGIPDLPEEFALVASKLDDAIPDRTEFDRQRKRELLFANDPEYKTLALAAAKGDLAGEIVDMQKMADEGKQKLEARQATQTQRQIQAGMSSDAVLPAEIKADPGKMKQIADLMSQGQTFEQALDVVKGGMPMGNPADLQTQQQGGANPNADRAHRLAQQLLGGELPVAPEPNPTGTQIPQHPQMTGSQGYNTGIPTGVATPAQLGAQPRTSVDQGNLAVDQTLQQIQRAKRPPAK